jgi:hypothetical protein
VGRKRHRVRAQAGGPPPSGFRARLRHFLGSKGHLVGSLFGIGGIVLLDGGLTSGAVGLALIPFLYVTGYFFATRPRPQPAAIGPAPTKDAPQVSAQLDELLATIRMRVPDDIYRRVRSIRDAIVFTLDRAGEASEIDPNIYLVRQTARTYLPEALASYLALPRSFAEREPVEDGRTSHAILLDQLVLMDMKTRQVAEWVMERDSGQLVSHGQFLKERYGASSLDATSEPESAKAPPRVH